MAVEIVPRQEKRLAETLSDEEIARRVRRGETALFEVLMRRHNQRVYRTVRSIIRQEQEVEDVMQQAYVQAYTHLAQFEGGSLFSTWLTRIAMNEALMRVRGQGRAERAAEAVRLDEGVPVTQPSPEARVEARELTAVLERAVDALPEQYRSVFVLREVEQLSTAEAAQVLAITEDLVKTRLRRARALVRDGLFGLVGKQAATAFAFNATRCDRVVAGVLARIGAR